MKKKKRLLAIILYFENDHSFVVMAWLMNNNIMYFRI